MTRKLLQPMPPLSLKQKVLAFVILALVMVVTRSHIVSHSLDASWALFFMLGVLLPRIAAFAAMFAVAYAIDIVVMQHTGNTFCYSPAYAFLVPAYASLWFAGAWMSQQKTSLLPKLLLTSSASIGLCFAVSNVGFYVYSGHFEQMPVSQYLSSVISYLPSYWLTASAYIAVAAIGLALYQSFKPAALNDANYRAG